ncbi:MAG TPA: hypothetical protein VFI46_06015 [Jiangellaceae bacterium]|nr:hypothetical protein [Jiangellaceae bacterium]
MAGDLEAEPRERCQPADGAPAIAVHSLGTYYASAAGVAAVEPSAAMRSRMIGRLDRCPAPVEMLDGLA